MEAFERLIDELHLEDLRNELHPSIFDDNEGYDMLIVRLPVIGTELKVKSLGFVLTKEGSYLYNRDARRFESIGGRFEGPHEVIDTQVDHMLKGYMHYQDLVGDMEERLYGDRNMETFMTEWLGLKRDLLRIERVLLRTSTVMKEVNDFYAHTEGFPQNSYIDIDEHIDRVARSAALQLSKLDYLYSFYNARTNDKMNKMIYILTIISAIFLPMNLVVGFFGMNTSGLPFAEGSSGTLDAVLLMLLLVMATSAVILLWRKRVEK